MAIRGEFTCTGSYDEVVARLRLALRSGDDLRGSVRTHEQLERAEFEARYKDWFWIQSLSLRAKGTLTAKDGECIASYRVGISPVTDIAFAVIGIIIVLLAAASWLDLLPFHRYVMLPGAALILGCLGFEQLQVSRMSRWIDRRLREYLKG